jgi:uncharacterized protein YkwD
MKISSIASVLSIFTAFAGMTLTAHAVVTLTAHAVVAPESNNVPKMSDKNLIAADSLEQSIHNQVNRYRQAQNLPPLAFDQTISEQARAHSAAMANSGRISHNGFDGRAAAIGQTITYSSVAENVASNQGYENPDNTAVKGWIKSPSHQRNMVGDFDLTGVGVVEQGGSYYFTQIFLRKR